MALLELTLQATFQGQEIINRFNYVSTGTPAAVSLSFALTSAFGCIYDAVAVPPGYPANTPFAAIRATQVAGVSYDQVSVVDVYSATDFYETPFLQAALGTRNGEPLPPFVAMGYRTGRVRRDIRRGTKRFVGLNETDLNSGAYSGSFTPLLAAVATKLGATLTYDDEGNTISFAPVIVGKQKYTPDPLRPERVAYRYYPTLAEQLDHIATGASWDYYSTPRSQTSRQVGKGR